MKITKEMIAKYNNGSPQNTMWEITDHNGTWVFNWVLQSDCITPISEDQLADESSYLKHEVESQDEDEKNEYIAIADALDVLLSEATN